MLNDYGYLEDPAHQNDSRWVHRPKADPARYEQRNDPSSIPGRVFASLKTLIDLRKTNSEFAGGTLQVVDTLNEHVLGFVRQSERGRRLLVFANFSERDQVLLPVVSQQKNLSVKTRLHGQAELLPDASLLLRPLDFVVFG